MEDNKNKFESIDEYIIHIGFYPAPSGIEAFEQELSGFKGAKGSIQFPINKPLPYELISKKHRKTLS